MIWLHFHRALIFCFLTYTELISHQLAFNKRAGEKFIDAPNSHDDKQGWIKNQNNVLKSIWQVGPILPRASVDIVDINAVEQEREKEVFVELDDFGDFIEEKQDTDFSTD